MAVDGAQSCPFWWHLALALQSRVEIECLALEALEALEALDKKEIE